MRAVDTNVLIHAFLRDAPLHDAAADEVRALASGSATWAIPWACIHEFFGVMTNRRLSPPADRGQAVRHQIEVWMGSPSLSLIAETGTHWRRLRRLVDEADITGPLIHDAKIAAICLDHGVTELLTLDRDFDRFPELKVRGLVG